MGGLLNYVVRRLLFAIPVFLAVSVITYLITNSAGDPVNIVRMGIRSITAAQLAQLRAFFHTDQPVYIRYFYWLSDFLRGNLGQSLYTGSVAAKILPWVGTTLELQIPALCLSLAIGIPTGIYSARHQYSKGDYTITTAAIFGISMPTFWIGIMSIILFSYYLRWLPAFGAYSAYPPYWWGSPTLDALAHVILPLSVLTLVSIATITRLTRVNMLEVLRQDYVLAARASGLPESKVIYKHALKNAITPVVTIVGLSFGTLLAGAPALETTFSWPGLGFAFVTAATKLDLPVVLALTMIITIMVLIANIATDLAFAFLDPRVRIT
ncbi:MAG TPA: ABC transporter permease [Nitrososphaerales archaeon]|nr:ABC transporter permease [Nitrososphaerales archaeon]